MKKIFKKIHEKIQKNAKFSHKNFQFFRFVKSFFDKTG